jgi:hypothetical protein
MTLLEHIATAPLPLRFRTLPRWDLAPRRWQTPMRC